MLEEGRADVENQYARVVRRSGNPSARQLIGDVFEIGDRRWRGIGLIPNSGYRLRREYEQFDALQRFNLAELEVVESSDCISGQILQGVKKPSQCPAFGTICTPQNPLGATMVSSEGACAAYYHYGRRNTSEAIHA